MPHDLLQPQYVIPLVGLSVSAIGMAVGIGWGAARSRERAREVEATRRKAAAGVAEGSLTPDEAERLIMGSGPRGRGCCGRRR